MRLKGYKGVFLNENNKSRSKGGQTLSYLKEGKKWPRPSTQLAFETLKAETTGTLVALPAFSHRGKKKCMPSSVRDPYHWSK